MACRSSQFRVGRSWRHDNESLLETELIYLTELLVHDDCGCRKRDPARRSAVKSPILYVSVTTGLFWSATTVATTVSRLERRLWVADLRGSPASDVVDGAAVKWFVGVPDFLLTGSDGRLTVVDVAGRIR